LTRGPVCLRALQLVSRWTRICVFPTTNAFCALRWAFLSILTVSFVLQ
jgi:hypothetical protein